METQAEEKEKGGATAAAAVAVVADGLPPNYGSRAGADRK